MQEIFAVQVLPGRRFPELINEDPVLLNDSFVLRQAACFADRVRGAAGADPAAQVTLAYRLAFGRVPSGSELADAAAFLTREPVSAATAESPAWIDFCHALLNANEFLYVD